MNTDYAAILHEAVSRIFENAPPRPGDLFVLGGSTSAVRGRRIGKAGDPQVARTILKPLLAALAPSGVVLAVQGCEHTNRALALPATAAAALNLTRATLVPAPRAGGALAAVYYQMLDDPAVAVDLGVGARYGLDVGGVLIGMHLQPVAVPVPLADLRLGEAALSGGYSRPPLIGGARAVYDEAEARRQLHEAFKSDA